MRTAGFCPPLMLTSPTPVNCESLGARRVSTMSSTCRERHAVGTDGKSEHRRVSRVGLVVDRRYRQIGGQKSLSAVDRRLNFFFGHVETKRQVELEHDDRNAAGAGRGHLAEALHLAELPLERRSDSGGHDVRAGAGIEGEHLNRRVIDFRQCGNRQVACKRRCPPVELRPSRVKLRRAAE